MLLWEQYITKQNPYWKNSLPMKLFDVSIVESKEKTDVYKSYILKNKLKKETLRKKWVERTVALKLVLFGYIDALPIKFNAIDEKRLIKNACTHYNNLWESRDEWSWQYEDKFADENSSDKLFLNRIVVNYLRHEYNWYEQKLDSLYWKTWRLEWYIRLKTNILNEIWIAYPFLNDEVKRQISLL
jgi:hypothetical protein